MLKPSVPNQLENTPHLAHVSHIFSQKKHGAVSFSTPAIRFSSSDPGARLCSAEGIKASSTSRISEASNQNKPMRSVILNGSVDLNLKANIVLIYYIIFT